MKLKGILFACLSLFLWMPLIGQAGDIVVATTPAATPTVAAPSQSVLTVHVTGIRNDNGVIRIGLFNTKESYEDKNLEHANAFNHAVLPIKNGVVTWQINNVPYGTYGIKLYHDEDNSGKLKKSFVGRPTEGVGFSNNPKLNNHAPTFDEVKFDVNQPQSDTTIQMINP